jgi:hypothetical protein
MSRCSPQLGWSKRLRRYGGLAEIAALRATQFQKLVQIGTEEARRVIAWLDGNPRRVLSAKSEIALGWEAAEVRRAREVGDAAVAAVNALRR